LKYLLPPKIGIGETFAIIYYYYNFAINYFWILPVKKLELHFLSNLHNTEPKKEERLFFSFFWERGRENQRNKNYRKENKNYKRKSKKR